jgi:hypothetical protein
MPRTLFPLNEIETHTHVILGFMNEADYDG